LEDVHLPPEVEVVQGDLTSPESLNGCLFDVDAAFLVWTAPLGAFGPALEQLRKRIRRLVFLSAPLKTPHPFFQQPNPSRTQTEQIEKMIEDSGLDWVFLRPGMLASNSLLWWAKQICAGDVVRWPCLSVPTAPIDERDIAAVAARVLCDEGHTGAEYVLSPGHSRSHNLSRYPRSVARSAVRCSFKRYRQTRRSVSYPRSCLHSLQRCCSMPGRRLQAYPPSLLRPLRKSQERLHERFLIGPPIMQRILGREEMGCCFNPQPASIGQKRGVQLG